MRKLLLILAFVAAGSIAIAQSNANEAKAAYLLAEESYGKGDYKNALEFLRQVREALGTVNCKVLYLQIMTTRELYAKDTGVNSKLLPLIVEFEKSADYADFSEEKSLEITKLKLLVKKEMKAAQEKTDAENKRKDAENKHKAETEKQLSDLVHKWGKFGMSLDEVDAAHPDWEVKTWKKIERYGALIYYPRSLEYTKSSYPFPKMNSSGELLAGKITGIVFFNGILYGYYSYVVDYEGVDYVDLTRDMKKASDAVTEKTGIIPIGNNYCSKSVDGPHATAHEWIYSGLYGDYWINDYQVSYLSKKGNRVARLLRYVQFKSSGKNK